MRVGVVFPQTEIGPDPEVVREYAETAEARGYDHLLAYDHVLGADPEGEAWSGGYDLDDQFHEPLTLFSHLAAVTDDLALVTGILVLPQRQTALVAKQTAEVDVLSAGRLRLGVGVGWNEAEYEALGEAFSERGRRIESQIPLLRDLWTEESVSREDEFHTLRGVGLNPRPVQRPIPVWMGGTADVVLRRAARLADGWLPQADPGPELDDQLARLREYAREAGRDPDELTVVGRMNLAGGDWVERVRTWRDLGVDYLSVDTMDAGVEAPSGHAETLAAFADELAGEGVGLE
ncbi:MAG: LLM class F420-dependent oxidoreductase [Halobacteriaceae archaeon]